MRFEFDEIGRWTEPTSFEVTAEHVKAYAAAINDTDPQHLRAALAPPLFAVVPAMRAGATRAADRIALSDASGYDLRKVHGEQDMFFLKPIIPKMVLYSRVAPIGVNVRSSGTTITAKSETRDQRDENGQLSVLDRFSPRCVRTDDRGQARASRPIAPPERRRNPVAVRVYSVDRDQPVRYAAASGNQGPYHLDESAAKTAGFPE
jgi:acyl dehydratase